MNALRLQAPGLIAMGALSLFFPFFPFSFLLEEGTINE
jgi:hypothetical protein